MPGAPLGSIVTLTYDLVHNPDWPEPDDGDCLVRERIIEADDSQHVVGIETEVAVVKGERRMEIEIRRALEVSA